MNRAKKLISRSENSDIDFDEIDYDNIDDYINIEGLDIEDDEEDILINIPTTNATEDDEDDRPNISKHKENDKHRLNHDIIFKGKKETLDELEDTSTTYFNDNFSYDPSTIYHHESNNNLEYIRENKLKEAIYSIIVNKTEVDITKTRRKPSEDNFNIYYTLAINKLSIDGYSNCEIFVELAFYFSNNLSNMFKLLKPKWRNEIIKELRDHIGKPPENSKELIPKNLSIGAEVEFEAIDEEDSKKIQIITGVIKKQNHDEGVYYIDTYESIYEVPFESIVKILDNERFRYNLNKLSNIDFL